MINTHIIEAIVALVAAWILGTILTGRLIPFLKKHQFQQFVREVGPQAHLSKTGTPSMGGFAIVGSCIIISIIAGAVTGKLTIGTISVLVAAVLFGIIGFIDDYEKAIKKNNKGISPKQKIVLQIAFSLAFAIFAYNFSGDYFIMGHVTNGCANSAIWIPLFNVNLDLGIFYIPWVMFVMVAFSNSVNLTDGLDGLASSVTTLVACCMALLAYSFGFEDYPIVMGALAGGCLGFLMYNKNPAKIFMGDTGSMALGGLLSAVGIMMKLEIILAIVGLVYVIEAVSVILQVMYFKKTHGKRLFKMAPIHHHFELCGLHEKKVVLLFDAATFVFAVIGIILSQI